MAPTARPTYTPYPTPTVRPTYTPYPTPTATPRPTPTIPPSSADVSPSQGGTFGLGSSESEVLSIQGTPSEIVDWGSFAIWHYGSSTVTLDTYGVTAWANSSGNLRVD